jgi:hypothetical protein
VEQRPVTVMNCLEQPRQGKATPAHALVMQRAAMQRKSGALKSIEMDLRCHAK